MCPLSLTLSPEMLLGFLHKSSLIIHLESAVHLPSQNRSRRTEIFSFELQLDEYWELAESRFSTSLRSSQLWNRL